MDLKFVQILKTKRQAKYGKISQVFLQVLVLELKLQQI